MLRYTKYIIGIVAILLTTGCRSSKQVTDNYVATVTDVTDNYNNMVDSCGEWRDVSVPVKVEIKSPATMSISGRARMVKDESIYISFRFFWHGGRSIIYRPRFNSCDIQIEETLYIRKLVENKRRVTSYAWKSPRHNTRTSISDRGKWT